MLPSNAHAAINLPSLRAPDGDINGPWCDYYSLELSCESTQFKFLTLSVGSLPEYTNISLHSVSESVGGGGGGNFSCTFVPSVVGRILKDGADAMAAAVNRK